MSALRSLVAAVTLMLALAACGPADPGRLNSGAAFGYDIVTDAQMFAAARHVSRPFSRYQETSQGPYAPPLMPSGNHVIIGLCMQDRILELHAGAQQSTPAHEACHLADRVGGMHAAIALLTPPNPSPEMAKRLALMREIAAAGPDHWANLYSRFGRDALGCHQDIIDRIEGAKQ